MRATVCELPDGGAAVEPAWRALADHVRAERSDLVLLPELAGYPWLADLPEFDPAVWREAVLAHDALIGRFRELGARIVLGTRPVETPRGRVNQSFAWTARHGVVPIHEKYYLPDEEGWYEARWFARGSGQFAPQAVDEVTIACLICTDAMFNERARAQGRQGAQVIAVPRASGVRGPFELATRMAALVSGCWVLTSNRVGQGGLLGKVGFVGGGWIVAPTAEIVCTTGDRPFATAEIDLDQVAAAKLDYPRYVPE
jgi:N-carbamoylputrescine amidase